MAEKKWFILTSSIECKKSKTVIPAGTIVHLKEKSKQFHFVAVGENEHFFYCDQKTFSIKMQALSTDQSMWLQAMLDPKLRLTFYRNNKEWLENVTIKKGESIQAKEKARDMFKTATVTYIGENHPFPGWHLEILFPGTEKPIKIDISHVQPITHYAGACAEPKQQKFQISTPGKSMNKQPGKKAVMKDDPRKVATSKPPEDRSQEPKNFPRKSLETDQDRDYIEEQQGNYFKQILRENWHQIVVNLRVEHFIQDLKVDGFFDEDTVKEVLKKNTRHEKTRAFLWIISTFENEQYYKMLQVVKEVSEKTYKELTEKIDRTNRSIQQNMNYKKMLCDYQEFLISFIYPTSIIDSIYSKGTFNMNQIRKLHSSPTLEDKATTLIEELFKKDVCDVANFLECLEETHIYLYHVVCGDENGKVWENYRKQFVSRFQNPSKLKKVGEVLGKMKLIEEVQLTETMVNEFDSKGSEREKAIFLRELVPRLGPDGIKGFLEALQETKQNNLFADINSAIQPLSSIEMKTSLQHADSGLHEKGCGITKRVLTVLKKDIVTWIAEKEVFWETICSHIFPPKQVKEFLHYHKSCTQRMDHLIEALTFTPDGLDILKNVVYKLGGSDLLKLIETQEDKEHKAGGRLRTEDEASEAESEVTKVDVETSEFRGAARAEITSAKKEKTSHKDQTVHSRTKSSSKNTFPHEVDAVSFQLPFDIGSAVEVIIKKHLQYGTVSWIGFLTEEDNKKEKLIAGLEMEQYQHYRHSGDYHGKRLYNCKQRHGEFSPYDILKPDSRFASISPEIEKLDTARALDESYFAGEVLPISNDAVKHICGRDKGIRGDTNSCYMDSTLFCMFAFNTSFDYLLNQQKDISNVLKQYIVNPLRSQFLVNSGSVLKFRKMLDELGKTAGLINQEKDPEEFLQTLFRDGLNVKPLLHLSSGEVCDILLIMASKQNVQIATMEHILSNHFLEYKFWLKEIPENLIVQFPRSGRDFKMYKKVFPDLSIKTGILQGWPDCDICEDTATDACLSCKENYYCEGCFQRAHKKQNKKGHNSIKLPKTTKEQIHAGTEMELYAVLSICTSHYVAFTKYGGRWLFFDSMADRQGAQDGYNIPEVKECNIIGKYLTDEGFESLLNTESDKDLPELVKRFFCDAFFCFYRVSKKQ